MADEPFSVEVDDPAFSEPSRHNGNEAADRGLSEVFPTQKVVGTRLILPGYKTCRGSATVCLSRTSSWRTYQADVGQHE